MPLARMSLIPIFSSLWPLLLVSLYQSALFPTAPSFLAVLSIMQIKLRRVSARERAHCPEVSTRSRLCTREEPMSLGVGLKSLGSWCGPATCRSIISCCDVLRGVGLLLVLRPLPLWFAAADSMMLTSPEGGLGVFPDLLLMLEYGSMLEFDQRLQTAGSRSVGCDGAATVSLRGRELGAMVRVPL
jgi:hypothetical protein